MFSPLLMLLKIVGRSCCGLAIKSMFLYFLVNSTLKSDHQSGTFKCVRVRCTTCPFISNSIIIFRPKQTVTIADHFTCISVNLIYCITCTLCKNYTSAKQVADWVTVSTNTSGMLLRDISTSPTILKNTWWFVAFLFI